MKIARLLLVIILSAGTAWGVSHYSLPNQADPAAAKETRFEQIKRTGVLRCGYYLWPPYLDRDMTTGQMKGLFADLFEETAKQLGVKIEWTTEIVHAHIPTDLDNNRYDVLCGMLFATPSRAREMGFTIPLLYHPAYLFVKEGDTRFDNNYAAANDPSVKFVILDGEFSAIAANERFPKAQKVSLPQNATGSDLMLNVANGKVDALITEMTTFLIYNKNNPGKVRRAAGPPESVIGAGFPVPQKEQDLKNALDTTLSYLQGTGFIDKLFDRYETPDNKFLRMPKPYILQQ